MEIRPFLLLSIRAEDDAADDEYRAMRRFGGLAGGDLRRVRMDQQELGEIDLDDWSGIILGGGPYNVSDLPQDKSAAQRRVEAELRDLLDRVVPRDFPFLGCCYGIGTVGLHCGATIDRTYGEDVGCIPVRLTDQGRADPIFGGLPDEFDAFAGHKEAVSRLPDDVFLLASSPDCPVQAFRLGSNVYVTQFHPELDVAGICTRIDVYKHHGYFAPDSAEALKASLLACRVTYPTEILHRFVQRYARKP